MNMNELQFSDCIQDSPNFRETLHNVEADTATLEHYLEKLVKNSSNVIEIGKSYNAANKAFKESLDELAAYSRRDELMMNPLNRFGKTWSEMISCHTILIDQMQRSVKTQINSFIKDDIKATKDLKKSFEKATDDYYAALARQSAANRNKPHEIEDAETNLAASKSTFHKTGMKYVFQINALHGQKKFHIVDRLVSFMHAVYTYFHQGYELFKDIQPYLKRIAAELEKNRKDNQVKEEEMKIQLERHKMIGDNSMYITQDKSESIIIQGHLFKRAHNAFKTWNRRWFVVKQNKLCYMKKHNESTAVVEDLRLCTVRQSDDIERRFCFEVISPGKLVVLQADSDDMRQAWLQAITTSINAAFKETMNPQESNEEVEPQSPIPRTASNVSPRKSQTSPEHDNNARRHTTAASERVSTSGPAVNSSPLKSKPSFLESKITIMEQLNTVPGNEVCADCKKSEPRWASVNLGILLCIDCSGMHRSLGVHLSKVRSLTLDSWDPDVIQIMMQLGNGRVNEVYEATKKPNDGIRPGCSSKDRLDFVKAKYVERRFARPLLIPNGQLGDQQLFQRWTVRAKKQKSRRTKENDTNNATNDESNNATKKEDGVNQGISSSSSDLVVFGLSSVPEPEDEVEYEESEIDNIENLDPNMLLYKSSRLGYLPVMILARANGANMNFHNQHEEGKTPLMQATIMGSIPACEYLLLNGAKINEVDSNGRSALHYAALCNNTGIACQFLKRKATDHDIADKDGKTALQIAVDAANADIVTLIRLKKMNDEMNEDPSSAQTDALVTDVFHDFSKRAASSDLPSPNPFPPSNTWPILNPQPTMKKEQTVGTDFTQNQNPVDASATETSEPVQTGLLVQIDEPQATEANTNNNSNSSESNNEFIMMDCESSV